MMQQYFFLLYNYLFKCSIYIVHLKFENVEINKKKTFIIIIIIIFCWDTNLFLLIFYIIL